MKYKILFVDDKNNMLKMIKRVFENSDFEVFTVNSAEKGMKIITDNSPISVIVSDYQMPVMDGVTFLLKVSEKYPDSIRILMSGSAKTYAVDSALSIGQIHKFIQKPFSPDDLIKTINNAATLYQSENNPAITLS